MNIIMTAKVNRVTGKTKHAIGTIVEGDPVATNTLRPADWVGIAEEEDGYYLLHFNRDGQCFADTWHDSLAAARRQAEFEFAISDADWIPDENKGTASSTRGEETGTGKAPVKAE